MSECRYILDANVLINAYRTYYAFDIAPSFWKRINDHSSKGTWGVIDKVADEIMQGQDQLADWLKHSYAGPILKSSDTNVISAYSRIITNIMNKSYKESARQEYARCADSWIIAHGLSRGVCVVTLENYQVDITSRIKIPNECKDYSIECIKTFDLLRRLGVTL